MFDPKAIAELRRALGLSLRGFAALLGIDHSTVCLWEQGKRHPTYKTMLRLNQLAKEQHPTQTA